MSIPRRFVALVLAGALAGCASTGMGVAGSAPAPHATGAHEALDLLYLLEEVDAAARAVSADRPTDALR